MFWSFVWGSGVLVIFFAFLDLSFVFEGFCFHLLCLLFLVGWNQGWLVGWFVWFVWLVGWFVICLVWLDFDFL